MSFRDQIRKDISGVFLDLDAFAERRTIIIDDIHHTDVPMVLRGLESRERHQLTGDHVQGIHEVTDILVCAVEDIHGAVPERGQRISVSEGERWRDYYVGRADISVDMLRLELEAMDE